MLAVHVAGGGHNDALVGGLAALAVALAVRRRNDLAGAAWVLAAFVKWIPLVFLVLATLAARARGNATGATRYRARGASWWPPSAPGATASTGCAWSARSRTTPSSRRATPFPPASSSSACRTAPPSPLRSSPPQRRVSCCSRAEPLRGEPRLGRAACLLLATTPYLAVWYLAWAVPLAAADEDRVARFAALALTAYLLPQTIPL